jgi:sugar/nucleoside kinase (ribokinase family)
MEPLSVPGFPVTELDSNGAGDTHRSLRRAPGRGGYAAEAARRANAAAAISVTGRGPAPAPGATELARFLSGVFNTGR